MGKLLNTIVTASLFLASAESFAQACRTPTNIEIYDRASRNAAHLLKVKLSTNLVAKVKVENIVVDEYGRNRARLPYVHTKPVIHSRGKMDKACVDIAVRSLTSMGFDLSDIAYRNYSYGNEVEMVRVSIPPRTFLYDQNGTLTVKSH